MKVIRKALDWATLTAFHIAGTDGSKQQSLLMAVISAIEEVEGARSWNRIEVKPGKTVFQSGEGHYVSVNSRFIQIQFQGRWWIKNGKSIVAKVKKTAEKRMRGVTLLECREALAAWDLNELRFHLTRLDPAKDVEVSIADLVPLPTVETVAWQFKATWQLFGDVDPKGNSFNGFRFSVPNKWTLRLYDKIRETAARPDGEKAEYYRQLFTPGQPCSRIELQLIGKTQCAKWERRFFDDSVTDAILVDEMLMTFFDSRHALLLKDSRSRKYWPYEPKWKLALAGDSASKRKPRKSPPATPKRAPRRAGL